VDDPPAPGQDGSIMPAPLPQVGEIRRTAVVAPLHLQREPDGSAAAAETDPFATPLDLGTTRAHWLGDEAPVSSSPSPGGASGHGEADHPRTIPAANRVHPGATLATLPLANTPPQSRGPVSVEIRAAALPGGSTRIVWRKADAKGASRESATPGPTLAVGATFPNGPHIMREAASEPVPSGDAARVATPTSASADVDLLRIAEKVSNLIARRARIERERRGRTR
jgi:hypothetical protein